MHVVREEDSIMIELNQVKDQEKIDAIDACVDGSYIIPGINGRVVNIDKSYKNMRKIGTFRSDGIVYDTILPSISITSHKDKYIISGNKSKKMVSFVFKLEHDRDLEQLENVLNYKDIIVSYFVDYDYLMTHTTQIKEMKNREFYSWGLSGDYTSDNLLFSNNLLSRISNHYANLCLVEDENVDVLDLCSKNDLFTIFPRIIVKYHPYDVVRSKLESGSIILFSMNSNTISELSSVVDYVKSSGYKIVGLSRLVSEELEG